MDYWRALQILGIEDDDGLTRMKLRRTYLRKLREHPPERDPDGFRDLREAFERVQNLVDDDPIPDAPSGPAVIQVIDANASPVTPSADVFTPQSAASSGSFASGASTRASASGSFASGVRASASASRSGASNTSMSAAAAADAATDAFVPVAPPSPDAFVPFSIPLLGSAPVAPPNDNRSSEYDFRPSDSRSSDSRPSDYRPASDSRSSDYRPPEQPVEPPRIIVIEAPRAKPAEPPVEPPRILAEPPRIVAEPPKAEPPKPERPKPASNLPPLSTLRGPEPPLPLSVLVPKLLQLLEAGHIQTALELEQDWRSSGDTDDYRQADIMIAAKWSLLRELLAVVAELPVQVTRPLARGLGMGKLDLARPELEAFRRQNQFAAEAANVLLAKRAPTIFRQIEGALYQAARVQVPPLYIPDPPPRASGGRGALGGVGIFAVIGMAVVRLMATGSHTSSSYDYKGPDLSHLDIPRFDYHPPPINFDMPPISTWVPPPRPYEPLDNTPETVWGSIYESSQTFTLYDIASPEQKAAASTFGNDSLDQSCKRSRASLKKLDAAPFIAIPERRTYAEMHLEAIHRWMDIVCKPAKKKTAPKSPPPELPPP